MSEWISVNDRLPIDKNSNGEESEDVLITDGEIIEIGYFESEYFIECDPDRYDGQSVTYSSEMWRSVRGYIDEPTHWMPLPNPPKEI